MKRYWTDGLGLVLHYWPVVFIALCDPVRPTWMVLGDALADRLRQRLRRRPWHWSWRLHAA